MRLTLGYSPCPNDCFIFDALVHNKIDTEGLSFEVILADVETLNRKAMQGDLDITKLSFHAYAHAIDKYILLRSGSALGFNCGPLLITGPDKVIDPDHYKDLKVAIPGQLTTANFLLTLAFPQITNKVEYVFSEIEEAVLSGKVDAGLIIHENRFTYMQKGLKKIADLGEVWEAMIHSPIPLGGIVIKRDIDDSVKQKVNKLIRKSVEYAFAHPESSMQYVREHAQEMDERVMKQHIELYVNRFSVDLGSEGSKAVEKMFQKANETGLFSLSSRKLIIDSI